MNHDAKAKLLEFKAEHFSGSDGLEPTDKKIGRITSSNGYLTVQSSDVTFRLNNIERRKILQGDVVEFVPHKAGGKKYATIVGLVKQGGRHIYGTIETKNNKRYLNPFDSIPQKLNISNKSDGKNNEIVKCRVVKHPINSGKITLEVVEVIAKKGDSDAVLKTALSRYRLTGISKPEYSLGFAKENKKDLTEIPFVTIDSGNAHELDDALFVEKQNDYYRAHIAISDVSSHVESSQSLQDYLSRKGFSQYLFGHHDPMFPDDLGHNTFSLTSNSIKPALVISFDVYDGGETKNVEYQQAYVKVKARLTYPEVLGFVRRGDESSTIAECELTESLIDIYRCYEILKKNRDSLSLITPDLPDYYYNTDDHGYIESVNQIKRNVAHHIVEEYMIAYNKIVAETLSVAGSGIFRLKTINEFKGAREKVRSLDEYIAFVASLKSESNFKQYYVSQSILNGSEFSINPGVHATLGLNCYLFATSPIRRFVDIINQQSVKNLAGLSDSKWFESYISEEFCEKQNSLNQRTNSAKEYMRQVLLVKYMKNRMQDVDVKAVVTGIAGNKIILKCIDSGARCYSYTSRSLDIGDVITARYKSSDERKRIIELQLNKV